MEAMKTSNNDPLYPQLCQVQKGMQTKKDRTCPCGRQGFQGLRWSPQEWVQPTLSEHDFSLEKEHEQGARDKQEEKNMQGRPKDQAEE